MSTTRDYTALREPVTRDEVAAFRTHAKATRRFSSPPSGVTIVVLAVAAFILITVFASFGVMVATAFVDEGSVLLPVTVVLVVALIIAAGIAAATRALRDRWERMMRQTRFAEANGLAFSPRDADPIYPGAIFHIGDSRTAVDHFVSTDGRQLDFGNYRYSTGSGKNRTTRTWGFLALRLDRRLPHMLLDARSNNGLFGASNLPVTFSKDQVLSLEGDFDRHFTLYCPLEYERDALYVFTPDLMALLIDNASAFDVEIIDDWMLVYSTAPFLMHDAGSIERLLRIVDTVGAKTLTQTDRYADDRAVHAHPGPAAGFGRQNTVASHGQRLKKRYPILIFIVVGAFIAFSMARLYFGF